MWAIFVADGIAGMRLTGIHDAPDRTALLCRHSRRGIAFVVVGL